MNDTPSNPDRFPKPRLSRRQRRVLALLVAGDLGSWSAVAGLLPLSALRNLFRRSK